MTNLKVLSIEISYYKLIDLTKFLPQMQQLRRLKIKEGYEGNEFEENEYQIISCFD